MARLKRKTIKLLPYQRENLVSVQDVEQKAGWEITAFNLPDAWSLTQGDGVKVAVLDTGCDLSHEDLVENLLPGINFVNPGKPPEDDNGHGSHVTGTYPYWMMRWMSRVCAAADAFGPNRFGSPQRS